MTFLFTDVEGSTRLLYELGSDAYAEALAGHRRVIREACSRHGGVEVDTQGDSFFVAFPTAPGAVAAAEEITDGLLSGQVRVRIGLNTGTPLVTDDGYVGADADAYHRALKRNTTRVPDCLVLFAPGLRHAGERGRIGIIDPAVALRRDRER